MDAELKAKWVEALRSGKYRQTRYCLRDLFAFDGDIGFCCLGVLADIQGAKWFSARPEIRGENAKHLEGGWLKPEFAGDLTLELQTTLSKMNDSGVSFDEIAKHIEANL